MQLKGWSKAEFEKHTEIRVGFIVERRVKKSLKVTEEQVGHLSLIPSLYCIDFD